MSRGFKKRMNGLFSKYDLQVGILQDKPYRNPKQFDATQSNFNEVLGKYAGGKIRKTERKSSGLMVSDVSKLNRERLGFNYLVEPFLKAATGSSPEIIKFTHRFLKMVFGKPEIKRVENLMQAIVRNPILRGEYGPSNAKSTQEIKGFDRRMIDTAQLFKAIKAKVGVRRV